MNLSKIKDDGERMNCKIDNFLTVRGLAWYCAYYVWSKWPWESFFFFKFGAQSFYGPYLEDYTYKLQSVTITKICTTQNLTYELQNFVGLKLTRIKVNNYPC